MKYFGRRAFENVVENPFLNMMTVGIIAMTLLLVGVFMLIYQDLNTVFAAWGRGVRVVAYLQPNISQPARDGLVTAIKNRPEVKSVVWIGKAEALKRFKSIIGENREILMDLAQNNPLPESLEIDINDRARSEETLEGLSAWLREQRGIGEVVYGQEWLERFLTMLNLFKIVAFVLGSFLLLAAMFIVSNTIKITLFARKEELSIMQLVGATPTFIKIPFVLEGSLQGLIGAIVAVCALYSLNALVMRRLVEAFAIPNFAFLSAEAILAIIVGGIVLGAGASVLSVGRFLEH